MSASRLTLAYQGRELVGHVDLPAALAGVQLAARGLHRSNHRRRQLRRAGQERAGSPEEKAAEVEAAVEFEASERGEDDPVAKSLLERLERLRGLP